MTLEIWLAYVGVISMLILFPGPFALLCVSHGAAHGQVRSLWTILGGTFASLALMTASSLGLGAILASSTRAFLLLKVVGAAYLIYLGISAWRQSSDAAIETQATHIDSAQPLTLMRTGFLVGISNPKDLLFFAALFPTFIQVDQPFVPQILTLALSWIVIDSTVMFLYCLLGTRITPWFAHPRNRQRFNRTTGSLFTGAGVTLLWNTTRSQ
ncbi:LysE family translocator [Marinobacter hydrocarbonoclasticus]|nr:LysE family translocator [Marinobacter nauticus]